MDLDADLNLDVHFEVDADGLAARSHLEEPKWLVWIEGGDPVGPVSAEQLARGIRGGKVPSDASVQRTGDVFWSGILDEPDVIAALKSL